MDIWCFLRYIRNLQLILNFWIRSSGCHIHLHFQLLAHILSSVLGNIVDVERWAGWPRRNQPGEPFLDFYMDRGIQTVNIYRRKLNVLTSESTSNWPKNIGDVRKVQGSDKIWMLEYSDVGCGKSSAGFSVNDLAGLKYWRCDLYKAYPPKIKFPVQESISI